MTQTRVWTLKALAEFLGASLEGDPSAEVTGLSTLQQATGSELTFLSNPAYQKQLRTTDALAVILKPELASEYNGNKLLLDNPYLGYARISKLFDRAPAAAAGIHPSASVDESANLGKGVSVGANASIAAGVDIGDDVVIEAGCVIGADTCIGAGSHLHANVTVYHGVVLGKSVRIHSGSVIGADGFGFAPGTEGWTKIHQIGGVVIGDQVEIGACTTVDRGALDDTCIGDGVIIDNQVQIAHNVKIGENTAIAGCTGIAGSTTIGRNCTIAGAVSIIGHLDICDGVHISVMTLVNKSISTPGSYSSGTVAAPTKSWRRNAVRFSQLDQIAVRLAAVEKNLASPDLPSDDSE
jgi:UDP-3-O-[3-hydroxymyristoyl] glucosamine N-acyltransferase